MATLYKHGEVVADYTRFVTYSNGQRIGYIFRLMSDGWVLVRPRRNGGRYKLFRKDRSLLHVQMTIDTFLAKQLGDIFH